MSAREEFIGQESSTQGGPRPYGPGKFDLLIDRFVYQLSCDGWLDDETGECDVGSGWYGIIREIAPADLDRIAAEEGDKLTPEEVAFVEENSAGCILWEQSQGFVSVDWYADPAELESDWESIKGAEETEMD